MPSGVAAVTAARGRGKSALAGQLISRIAGRLRIVHCARKAVTDVLAQFAGEVSLYCADALLASDEQSRLAGGRWPQYIPAPLLHQLVSRFPSERC